MHFARKIRRLVYGAIALGCVLLGSAAHAGSICNFQENSAAATAGIGRFSGSLEYEATGATTGVLTVTLTNIGTPTYSGYITAFVFNIGSADAGATAALTSSTHSLLLNMTDAGRQADPFGHYEAGAGLFRAFDGGGNETFGIAAGDTGVFTFQINASDAGSLTAHNFIDGPDNQFNFVTRFRGGGAADGDRAPGTMLVPLPAALGLGAAGLGLVMIGRRKKRRAAATQ